MSKTCCAVSVSDRPLTHTILVLFVVHAGLSTGQSDRCAQNSCLTDLLLVYKTNNKPLQECHVIDDADSSNPCHAVLQKGQN